MGELSADGVDGYQGFATSAAAMKAKSRKAYWSLRAERLPLLQTLRLAALPMS
jgi:hypothetical protein